MGYMKVSYQLKPIRALGKIKYSHSSYECTSSKLNILSSKERCESSHSENSKGKTHTEVKDKTYQTQEVLRCRFHHAGWALHAAKTNPNKLTASSSCMGATVSLICQQCPIWDKGIYSFLARNSHTTQLVPKGNTTTKIRQREVIPQSQQIRPICLRMENL